MNFLLHTQPGIEKITKKEIEEKSVPGKIVHTTQIQRKNGILEIGNSNYFDISKLRTIEDVFSIIHKVELYKPPNIDFIFKTSKQIPQFENHLRLHRKVIKRYGKTTTFRVIVRVTAKQDFKRSEVESIFQKEILKRYNCKWKTTKSNPQLEFWITLTSKNMYIVLRITDMKFRQAKYKIQHIPGTLRPSVAAALIFLSEPKPSDVFLDPMCGAGTILIERALHSRYKQLLGGDISSEAISATRANIGNKYEPIAVRKWDATNLPLKPNSVNKIVSNLPFGKQFERGEKIGKLYRELFNQIEKVSQEKSVTILLTNQLDLISNIIQQRLGFKLKDKYKITLLGQKAFIVKIAYKNNFKQKRF